MSRKLEILLHSQCNLLNLHLLCQGYVGCLVDTELVHDKHVYSGARSLYYAHDSAAATARVSVAHETLTTRTPDTSFYQWVPFVLVFQVQWE